MATTWINAPATPTEPDHSKCRHCSFRISWDDYCYTHDASGFADCIIVGPPKPGAPHTYAEPIEWGNLMGSKNNPGNFDCYENAEPDEPMFVLLARDRHASTLVREWADRRQDEREDAAIVAEARKCADDMDEWRRINRPPKINTSNDYLLSTDGDTFEFLRAPRVMTREVAIRTAAHLVALADPYGIEFAKVLEAMTR